MLDNIIITKVKATDKELEIAYAIETAEGVQSYATKFEISEMNTERYMRIVQAMQKMRCYLLNLSGTIPSYVLETYLDVHFDNWLDSLLDYKPTRPRYVQSVVDIADYSGELNRASIKEVLSDDGYRCLKLKGEVRVFNSPAKAETPKVRTTDSDLRTGECLYPYRRAMWQDFQSLAVLCQQLIRADTERVAGQLDMFSVEQLERAAMDKLNDFGNDKTAEA